MTLLNNMLRTSLLHHLVQKLLGGKLDTQVDTHLNTSILYFLSKKTCGQKQMFMICHYTTLIYESVIFHQIALPDMGIWFHALPVFCTSVNITGSLKILCNHFRIFNYFCS